MCRSVLQNVATENSQAVGSVVSFSKLTPAPPVRPIVAAKGLKVVAPWLVLKSQQYQGRYFFFNTETNESQWSLHPSLITNIKPRNSEISHLVRTNKACLSDETDTTNESEDSAESESNHSEEESLDSMEEERGSSYDNLLNEVCCTMEEGKLGKDAQQPLVPADESYPHFEVVGGLGMGGYATVVKVKHVESQKEFAMKVVTKAKVNEKNRQILAFELQVMTETEPSPFLQRCHLAFENDYNLYFILDLNAGGDLFHHLMKRCESGEHMGLDENELRVILSELYLGLEHLHNHNIIHRDIKIENVMLDHSGHVKLIDFGLAKQISKPVEQMSPAGSLIYMAPELIAHNIGGRHTDWWAYGVMAFELLTGRTPWSSMTDAPVIKREIQTVDVKPYLTEVSPCANRFICSLMNKDFRTRLGTNNDQEIMGCSFFKTIDWELCRRLETSPAFQPDQECTTAESRQAALKAYQQLRDVQHKHQNNWTMGLEDAKHFLV